jgi:hypothetical protein
VSETFSRTKRAVLDYEDAAKKITEDASIESTLSFLRPEAEVEKYSEHDLRGSFFRYNIHEQK